MHAAPRLIFAFSQGRKLNSVSCLQAVGFDLMPVADEASSPPAVVFLGVSSSYSPLERLNSTLPQPNPGRLASPTPVRVTLIDLEKYRCAADFGIGKKNGIFL